MKKNISGIFFVMVLSSCLNIPTVSNPYRPLSDFPNAVVIGTIDADFGVTLVQNNVKQLNQHAFMALLNEVMGAFDGINIDIVDISYVFDSKQKTGRSEEYYYFYIAIGKVISLDGKTRPVSGIERALELAANDVSESFNVRSRIAIVYIIAEDRNRSDFFTGELEHILLKKGFIIIDRSELDKIRAEQRFGASGEVDDSTAARIGNLAGASVVITGRVDGEANLRRLRLRALDTASGQVVGTASERL